MSRLLVQLKNDFRLLVRHNLVGATVFMTVFWAILFLLALASFPAKYVFEYILPIILLTDTSTMGFYFLAGMVLFEKDQNVISGLVVSPLTSGEYIWSKVVSMGLLTALSGGVIAIASVWGRGMNMFWAIVGLFLIAVFYSLVGFISVAKIDNITKYLFVGSLYFVFFNLPILGIYDVWKGFTIYLHPVWPFALLMQAPFVGIEIWQILYSLGYIAISITIAFIFAKNI
ncbi:MAG: ABC transporter permease [Caldisericia bacterium]